MSLSVSEVALSLASLVIGGVAKVVYDEVSAPKLVFKGIEKVQFLGKVGSCVGIRLRVENHEKHLFNRVASDCVAWLQIDGSSEKFQITWIPTKAETGINVGDFRYIDLCAREVTGRVIAPTERGWYEPDARELGDGTARIRGTVSVSCSNGRPVRSRLEISPIGSYDIDATLGGS